jgi:aspartate racemase
LGDDTIPGHEMKRIGMIGGLGPEATIDYYRLINDEYHERTHGQYPEIIIYSLNMSRFVVCQMSVESSEKIMKWLAHAVEAVYKSGADFALIASNTPHIVFDELQSRAPIPLISIVEETCKAARHAHLKKLALLGTKVTMDSQFYQRVFTKHHIEIITPGTKEKEYINEKLFKEVLHNKIVDETRHGLLEIIERLIEDEHIDGVILGCTELPLILTKDEFNIPFLNTTKIHAKSAVKYSLE